MIDMSNIGRDFMPRKRPDEVGGGQPFAPPPAPMPPGGMGGNTPAPLTGRLGMGQQPFTPAGVPPQQPPPGGGQIGAGQWQDPMLGRGGQVSAGQQPFTPVGVPPPDMGPPGRTVPEGGLIHAQPGAGWGDETSVAPGGIPGGQNLLGGGYRPQQPPEGYQQYEGETGVEPGVGGFPYPEQWQQAGDIYGQLAGGMPGMPDPSAIWGGYQQQAGDLSRELAEQAGMGMGGRYGSALQRNIADVGMRAGERFGGEMERMRMGDLAGQRQAMLGAAGGLSGLGGAQAMLPGQLAGQAMGLGQQYQGMQNIPLQAQYQEFMRTQPEYSPYLPYMQQGSQVPYGPQTYQPGFGSNMMDIGGMMGMYGMMGQGGWG